MPSLFKRALNFIKALYNHATTGFRRVSMSTYDKRITTCSTCVKFIMNEQGMKCGACGCNLYLKAQWKEQECPLDKW